MTLVTAVVKSKTTVVATTNSVQVGGDVRVVNSNGSFDNTYEPDDSPVTLPNITKTDSDGTTSSIPSNEDVTCSAALPVTEQVNGVTIGTAASGTTNSQVINDTLGAGVGTSANPSVVGNATVSNSDASFSLSVLAEGTGALPDTPISANGDLVINQPSTIAKNLVVRYDTEGVVPTTISGGEIVVPDTGIISGREPFVMFGTSANTAWVKTDKFGNFVTLANANIAAWQDSEAGEVAIEFAYTMIVERTVSTNDFWIGFDESASPTASTSNFTGLYYDSTTQLRFMENGSDMGVIDNPSTQNWPVYKCIRDIGDGLFRAYRDGTLIYTSSHSASGSIFPYVKSFGANNKYMTNIYVTS